MLAALGVIASRNPVHSALFLVLSFVQSAMLWLLLEAEFLAVVLVLVYVGAVMVLFLFVVMMLDINEEALKEGFARYLPIGVLVALVLVLEIVYVVWYSSQNLLAGIVPESYPPGYSNTEALGRQLHTVCTQYNAPPHSDTVSAHAIHGIAATAAPFPQDIAR